MDEMELERDMNPLSGANRFAELLEGPNELVE